MAKVPKYRHPDVGMPHRADIKGPNVERWAAIGNQLVDSARQLREMENKAFSMYMSWKGERDQQADDVTTIDALDKYNNDTNQLSKDLEEQGLVGDEYLNKWNEGRDNLRQELLGSTEFRKKENRRNFELKVKMFDSRAGEIAIGRAHDLDVNKTTADVTRQSNDALIKSLQQDTYEQAVQVFQMGTQGEAELAKKGWVKQQVHDNRMLKGNIAIQAHYAEKEMLADPNKPIDRKALFERFDKLTGDDADKLEKARQSALKANQISMAELNHKINNEVQQFLETGEWTNRDAIISEATKRGPDTLNEVLANFQIAEGAHKVVNSFSEDGVHVALTPFDQQAALVDEISPKVGDPFYKMKADARDNMLKVIANRQKAAAKDPKGYIMQHAVGPDGKALFDNANTPQAIEFTKDISEKMGLPFEVTSVGWRKAWKDQYKEAPPDDKQIMVQALDTFGQYKGQAMDELGLGAAARINSDPYVSPDVAKDLLDLDAATLDSLKTGLEDPKRVKDNFTSTLGDSDLGKVMKAQVSRNTSNQAHVQKMYKQIWQLGEKKAYRLAQTDEGGAAQGSVDYLNSIYGAIYDQDNIAIYVDPKMDVRAKDELTDALEWYRESVIPKHTKWVQEKINIPGMPDLGASLEDQAKQAVWQNGPGRDAYILVDEYGRSLRDQNGHQIVITKLEILTAYKDAMATRKADTKKRQKEVEEFMIP